MLDTRRHDQLFDSANFDLPVHIVGVGGVGSHVARMLAKLGVGRNSPVTVYDGDRVEPHNLANQAYEESHIGLFKVEALYDQYRKWSGGVEIYPVTRFVESKEAFSGVVFLCLDNMNPRKQICEESVWRVPGIKLLVETRTSIQDVVVFTLDPNRERHIDIWNAYWYPAEEADNDMGCNGPMSIITSVEATAVFAVQSFIDFIRVGNADHLPHRFVFDLLHRRVLFAETWE